MSTYNYEDGLESDRLITRFITLDDASLWEQFYSDPQNYQYLPNLGGSSPAENAVLAMQRQLKRYQRNNYGLQALIVKETNELIGQCGLLFQEVNGVMEYEIGYQLFTSCRGKGYAAEAGRLFRDYGFKKISASSIICLIDIENIASHKVAQSIGMSQERQITYYDGSETFIYRISREKWESL